MSGHMAQGKPQLKFERNPCNNFRDNRCHRRTTEEKSHTISSADRVKQSYKWFVQIEKQIEIWDSVTLVANI